MPKFRNASNLLPRQAQTAAWSSVCCLAILAAGCAAIGNRPPLTPTPQATPTEDRTYLSPIPDATLFAWRDGQPIETPLQAAIAARRELRGARLEFKATPAILSVEKTTFAAAVQRIPHLSTSYGDPPGDTPVWLVIFSGEYRINPPTSRNITPDPYHPGCAYALFTDDPYGGAGTADCQP